LVETLSVFEGRSPAAGPIKRLIRVPVGNDAVVCDYTAVGGTKTLFYYGNYYYAQMKYYINI
jgi:hypothetical protein